MIFIIIFILINIIIVGEHIMRMYTSKKYIIYMLYCEYVYVTFIITS